MESSNPRSSSTSKSPKKSQVSQQIKKKEPEDVNLNIYMHLKAGSRNSNQNCRCGFGEWKRYYCIPCKISICEKCKLKDHLKHSLIEKKKWDITENKIQECFKPLKEYFNEAQTIKNLDSIKTVLQQNIYNTYNQLHDLVVKWKEDKIKEINDILDNIELNSKSLQEKYTSLQKDLLDYAQKNSPFFNLGEKNKDVYNTIFLTNYDVLTLSKRISSTIKSSGLELEKLLFEYRDEEIKNYPKIVKDVEKILNPTEINEKYAKVKNTMKTVSTAPYKDIETRLFRYNKLIDSFKKNVLKSVTKCGTYKEIEKENLAFEKNSPGGIDNLFSKRRTSNARQNLAHLMPEGVITKKEHVILNNPVLNKHYGYLMNNLYETYFKQEVKEMRSSHADLKIKVNDEDETNVGRVLEGTNQILIFNKKTNRMERKTLNLTKNPYGYTKFPVGVRSILIGDKFYITGGKDETQEYANVLIYDRNTDKLKRIMDMRNTRCYHTLIFNELFETLIVVGGEENGTVELFDPLTNRWQELPELNFPRAHTQFYFDESRGKFYVMFGMEGPFLGGNYSDIIETLDLKHIDRGWEKLNYYNKITLNLKMHLNMIPLNSDLLLIYGGMESRKNTRAVCVMNVPKAEIGNVDPNLMEELRREAKNSRRLSMIVASCSASLAQSQSNY